MVDSPDRAMALIEELYQGTKDIVTKRISNLKEALDSDQPLQKWDMEYAKRLVIGKQTGGFSPLDARQYFRVQKVIPGLLQFAEEFYGVKLQARPDVKTWHDNVIVYDVYNNNEGRSSLMGRIYLDCLFREDKENHPCTLGLTTGVEGKQYPEGVLVVGLEGGPEATMHFWDATACWHELGHLFHHILGAKHQCYHRFSGFEGIQYEFIEAPSQLAEEWIENPQIVQRFAVNKRGETISEAMLQNLIQSERIVNPLVTCQRLLWARIAVSVNLLSSYQ
jgi:thimet oligopeptidase